VEPYFGGGSVLLHKDPEGVSEVVNDVNGELTNFWYVLQNSERFSIFLRFIEATPFSETEFNQNPGAEGVIDRAADFFIRARQSRQGLMKDFATLSRNRTRRGMNEQVSSWLTTIEGLPDVHSRLKRVVILNRPALDVIHQQDGPKTCFYLDPPYLHETRSTTKEYGEQEMTGEDHLLLLDTLSDLEGKFLLSGYQSHMYDDFADAQGWSRYDFRISNNAASGKTKETKTECIYANVGRGQ
jgi:DNA adenine methylase